MGNTTCCSWVNTSGDFGISYIIRSLNKPFSLKETPSGERAGVERSSLTYLTLIVLGFGDHCFRVHSKH